MMNRCLISLIAILFLAVSPATLFGRGGGGGVHVGGGGFHGGGGGGAHFAGGGGGTHFSGGGGGLHFGGAGGWHAGGGIAGGGWHGGGLPAGEGRHMTGFGGLPAAGHVGIVPNSSGGGPLASVGRLPLTGHLPGAGIGFVPGFSGQVPGGGFMGRAPGFAGALGVHGPGWAGGLPGAAGYWAYAHPHSWYNGYWHNHYFGNGFGGYWGGMSYPLGWGMGGWGPGSLWYQSGYMPYNNPYYNTGYGGWNYGQPIPMSVPAGASAGAAAVPSPANLADAGNPAVDAAVKLFRAGDDAGALAQVDRAIQGQPTDAAAHELRALILFAQFDYAQAAATIHSVLAVGPGWDWTTLSSIYSDIGVYEGQLQGLEGYVAEHPDKADARFLLAYHYMTAGHTDAAAAQLRQVVKLMPRDKLAGELLAMVTGGRSAPPAVSLPAGSAPTLAGAPSPGRDIPVDPAALVGSWHARRGDGSNFDLTLARDKTFTWNFAQRRQPPQMITGNYSVDNGLLILQGTTNGAMVGRLADAVGDRFTFKPLGGPPDDPGLTFTR